MAQHRHDERRSAALIVAGQCVRDDTGPFDLRALLDMLGLLDPTLRGRRCQGVRRQDLLEIPPPFAP